MFANNNSDLTQEIRDAAKLNVLQGIPSLLSENIVPVLEINPKNYRRCLLVKHADSVNVTSTTIHTCDSIKDTFLVSASVSVIKDVTSTSLASAIGITPYGGPTTPRICRIAGISLTPQSATLSMSFNPPIRLAKGSAINLLNSTNVANVSSSGSIVAYEVENTTA